MTMNLKINDIERFFCDLVQDLSNPFSRDVSYWTVDGTNFDTWGKEHNVGGEDGYKQWITTTVIPNLKKRFDYLVLQSNGTIFGVKGSKNEVIDTEFFSSVEFWDIALRYGEITR
ncbi:MAG TPA: hypothetical protein VED16_01645 [Candidatus Acidoferrum sp.]|nr:hypothetical protein [Candidatus Acidoferrum sp.]